MSRLNTTVNKLQRAQEVQDVLLLAGCEVVVEDKLHRSGFTSVALVRLDSAEQVAATSIVEEEDALSQTPQGSRTELISASAALRDVVCQGCPHVMDLKIAEQVGSSVAQTSG